jgi:hypothetical protein
MAPLTALTVYRVQVEQKRGVNAGKTHYIVIRVGVDGKLSVPACYRLIAVMGRIR